MSQGEQTPRGTKFRHGLAVTLFTWFMLLSLTPLAIIGINEYHEGRQTIVASRYEQLSTINLLLSEQINDYFDLVVTNLFIKAGVAQEFLAQLVKQREAVGQSSPDFISSPVYHQVLDQYASEFVDFLRYYDYSDVILADQDGNIVYTVNGYADLGQNLFQGKLSSTAFAQAARESFEFAEPRYADVGNYPPIGDQYVSFFVLPLVDERENITGLIAVQLLSYNVQSIFESDHPLGQGLKSYLVGTDAYIRYGTELESSQTMKLKADNPLIENWLEHFDPKTNEYLEREELHGDLDLHGEGATSLEDWIPGIDIALDDEEAAHDNELSKAHIRSYKNVYGERVLGIFYPISVAGTPMAMISEVSEVDAFASVKRFRERLIYLTLVTAALVLFIGLLITRRLVQPIRTITDWVNKVAAGDYAQGTVLSSHNEIGQLSRSFSEMTEKLRNLVSENSKRSWMQDGQAGLNDSMRGEQDIAELCRNVVSYLAKYLGMQTGAIYVVNDERVLLLTSSYAWSQKKPHSNKFELGEGIVGQAALEQQTIKLTDVPDNYLMIESGLGSAKPHSVIVMPLVYEKEVKGVFEFAQLKPLTEDQVNFLEQSQEKVAIAINSAQFSERVKQLLDKTTKQSEALKEQQEELKSVNEELEKRARILEDSQEELRAQSEEMQKSNAELEEKTGQLQIQKEEILRKNLDIERSSQSLKEKAKELELASKYKSEFLANMSHELRTPLNSLLLLAQMLSDNDEENLTEDQVESAQVIYQGGKELLDLINDILDLSKVEAGKMSISLEQVDLKELSASIKGLFKPLADDRGLTFSVEIEPGTTLSILTDSQRLTQILKNFLSNAFKFTEKGSVSVQMANTRRKGAHGEETYVGFSVKDSGIGIPEEKQATIFEAFRQADGSTSRKYGGTGLGLTISREMAGLLGGYIDLQSVEGQGTTFTLYLPDNAVCSITGEKVFADNYAPDAPSDAPSELAKELPGTGGTESYHHVLLVDSDHQGRADIKALLEKEGMVVGEAASGQEAQASMAANHWQCIVMDVELPDGPGHELLEKLQETMGGDLPTVAIYTGKTLADDEHKALQQYTGVMVLKGGIGPERLVEEVGLLINSTDKEEPKEQTVDDLHGVNLEGRKILLVDDDLRNTFALSKRLQGLGLEVVIADNGAVALAKLEDEQGIELVLMDIMMPVMDGYEATRQIRAMDKYRNLPIIALTAKAMSGDRAKCLKAGASDYMTKPVELAQLAKTIKNWLNQ